MWGGRFSASFSPQRRIPSIGRSVRYGSAGSPDSAPPWVSGLREGRGEGMIGDSCEFPSSGNALFPETHFRISVRALKETTQGSDLLRERVFFPKLRDQGSSFGEQVPVGDQR